MFLSKMKKRIVALEKENEELKIKCAEMRKMNYNLVNPKRDAKGRYVKS